ncbi:MAG: extracellular solute-binding protein [Chloroflexota bacterium]|nr:extracellular solute-binding protein [Chloroflexota bacterium]
MSEEIEPGRAPRITRREALKTIGYGTVTVAIAACGGNTGGRQAGVNTPESLETQAPPVSAQSTGGIPTRPPAVGKKTQLVYWDSITEGSPGIEKLIKNFNQKHKDIQVVRQVQTTQQSRDVIRTALDAGQGPDVFQYDTGPGFAGVLARAGLLQPLEDAYKKYGWDKRFLPIAKQRTTFQGVPYGIGHQLEVVGVFYNKRIFDDLGLQEPKTHDELLQICEKIKGQGGIYPIAFGDKDKWPAGHTFSVFAGNIAGREKLAKAISAETPWDDPDFVKAINIPFVEMNKKGYWPPTVNAISYDDWQAVFYSGKAAMSLTGTWMIGSYSPRPAPTPAAGEEGDEEEQLTMQDPVGFFFYPSVDGKQIAPPSGLGIGYFVNKKAKNPEAAYQFLDYLFSEEAAPVWIEDLDQIPPIEVDASKLKVSDLMRQTLDSLQKGGDTMGYNIDVLTPENFNTVMFDGFQTVLAGKKTAEQQAKDLQAAMKQAKQAGKTFDITQ